MFGIKRRTKHFLTVICNSIGKFLLYAARLLPLQNKIVFNAWIGKGFCDEPKYILLELLKQKVNAKYIWLVNDLNAETPPQVKKVKYGSWLANFHYITAKIWIDNTKSSPKPQKRLGQFYLQTWHGCWGPKGAEQAVENQLSKEYIEAAKLDASKTDLMYINNEYEKQIYENSFWYDGPVINANFSSLSILLRTPEDVVTKIRKAFDISLDRKIVIYAPTFRNEFSAEVYIWDYERIIRALENRFGGEFVLLVRLHPNIATRELGLKYSSIIKDATQYLDMYELLAASDVLITDISSTMSVMAFAKRPVFLFAKDFDEYAVSDRPLIYPLKKLPFTISRSVDELEKSIIEFDKKAYDFKTDAFMSDIGFHDDGHGAEKICRILLRQL
ncbi:CDP-glycerol glycerophosphotransferase family protein [bacterium]|nr:CDP-glycerol glycerophosphotransferase family protein [bacterium]